MGTISTSVETHLFKQLCVATLVGEEPSSSQNPGLWAAFEQLGLVERYEQLVASVGYEYIDKHVLEESAGNWAEPGMVESLREWMSKKIIPWLLILYARGATTRKSRLSVAL